MLWEMLVICIQYGFGFSCTLLWLLGWLPLAIEGAYVVLLLIGIFLDPLIRGQLNNYPCRIQRFITVHNSTDLETLRTITTKISLEVN